MSTPPGQADLTFQSNKTISIRSKKMCYVFWYTFPVGRIGIAEEDNAIVMVGFMDEKECAGCTVKETILIKKTAGQLDEYFKGKRKIFDLPLSLHGTGFQKAVWKKLQKIPFGRTRSYKDIAVMIGNPKASRAVGMAANRNPVSIIVPCHRMLGSNGSLTGYAGGLHIKEYLLNLEKKYV